jgi:hypothetical protein
MENTSRCGFLTNEDFLRIGRLTLIPQSNLVNPACPSDEQLLVVNIVEVEFEFSFPDLHSQD